jgi:hypothetical protein
MQLEKYYDSIVAPHFLYVADIIYVYIQLTLCVVHTTYASSGAVSHIYRQPDASLTSQAF